METNIVRMTVSSGPAQGEQREVLIDEQGKEYVNMGINTPRKTLVSKLSDTAAKEIQQNKLRLQNKNYSTFAVKLGVCIHKLEKLLLKHRLGLVVAVAGEVISDSMLAGEVISDSMPDIPDVSSLSLEETKEDHVVNLFPPQVPPSDAGGFDAAPQDDDK